MMQNTITIIIWLIDKVATIYLLLILLNVFLPYFVPSTNRIRMLADQLVEPLLALIRRYIPLIGRFDISPVILVILVQLVSSLLIRLLSGLSFSG